MGRIHANKAALVLGALMGGWHLIWAILVALGWGQKVIDFVLWMHFIKPVYIIDSFKIGTAAVLIVITSAIGYAVGGAFAIGWNYVQRP